MTQETDLTNEGNPIDATPQAPGESLAAGDNITSLAAPTSITGGFVTVPAIVVPPAIKETFLQKVEIDAEEAYHWLVAEIHKLYTKI